MLPFGPLRADAPLLAAASMNMGSLSIVDWMFAYPLVIELMSVVFLTSVVLMCWTLASMADMELSVEAFFSS